MQITEEMKIHEEWYKEANAQTLETLPKFIEKLTKDYSHDYGTICHAITSAGIATMNAINKSDVGGITGFQAGAIMWEFIRHWNRTSNKCGLRLVDYDNMMFPQYEREFEKTISKETFTNLQNNCRENIEKNSEHAHERVIAHWQSIVDGNVPFGYSVKEEE